MEIKGILGERIRFVPLDPQLHLDNVVAWFNDPEVRQFLNNKLPISRQQEEKWFEKFAESKEDIVWAVHDEQNKHIGITGVHQIDWEHRSATTGLLIGDKAAWGKGYGSDIVKTRTRFLFDQLNLHRLESECFTENQGMIKIFEKCGYQRVGILRQKRWRDGRWRDMILWEILDEDYQALKSAL